MAWSVARAFSPADGERSGLPSTGLRRKTSARSSRSPAATCRSRLACTYPSTLGWLPPSCADVPAQCDRRAIDRERSQANAVARRLRTSERTVRLRARATGRAAAGHTRVAAFDLGASGGRVIVGAVGAGRLELHEIHRFPNIPVRVLGTLHWDVLRLYTGALDGLRAAAGRSGLASIGID